MLAQTTTHISLLARLTGGSDERAWAEFCERYEELIRSFARRRGVSPVDQDDVVQDVLLALTKTMPGFVYDPAKGKFRSYLKTIALHAIFRRSCQKGGAASIEELSATGGHPPASDDAEEAWEAEWRQYHLRTAMKTLRARFNSADLAAFDLYACAGRSAEETARDVGLTVDQVYQAKSRILKTLSQAIAVQVEEEG